MQDSMQFMIHSIMSQNDRNKGYGAPEASAILEHKMNKISDTIFYWKIPLLSDILGKFVLKFRSYEDARTIKCINVMVGETYFCGIDKFNIRGKYVIPHGYNYFILQSPTVIYFDVEITCEMTKACNEPTILTDIIMYEKERIDKITECSCFSKCKNKLSLIFTDDVVSYDNKIQVRNEKSPDEITNVLLSLNEKLPPDLSYISLDYLIEHDKFITIEPLRTDIMPNRRKNIYDVCGYSQCYIIGGISNILKIEQEMTHANFKSNVIDKYMLNYLASAYGLKDGDTMLIPFEPLPYVSRVYIEYEGESDFRLVIKEYFVDLMNNNYCDIEHYHCRQVLTFGGDIHKADGRLLDLLKVCGFGMQLIIIPLDNDKNAMKDDVLKNLRLVNFDAKLLISGDDFVFYNRNEVEYMVYSKTFEDPAYYLNHKKFRNRSRMFNFSRSRLKLEWDNDVNMFIYVGYICTNKLSLTYQQYAYT